MSDDSNQHFLQTATAFLDTLNVRYMEADLDEQLALKDKRDRAIRIYTQARLAILKRNILCQPDDLTKMTQLREDLSQASNLDQIVNLAVRFAGFLSRRFL